MGTTMQSIAGGRGTQIESAPPGQHLFPERGGQWQRPQRSVESPEANFTTPVQNTATLFAQAAAVQNVLPLDGSAASQPRSAQPPNAPNSNGGTQNQQAMRGAHTPTPNTGPAPANAIVNGNSLGNGNPANMSARGPVEFNHAISYVNKIKVRKKMPSLIWAAHHEALLELTSYRIGSRTSRRFINNFWRFCKHIKGNKSPSKTCTLR